MGKFAGFLKRAKQMFNNGVKGVKFVKDLWNTYITKPGVALLNTVMPETKPITDILFTIDNKVNQGIDWIIDKTKDKKIDPNKFNDNRPVKPLYVVGPNRTKNN